MAGEIKPGDTVWMPQKIVHVYPEGELKTEDAFICPPSYVMRDHPALSAVAQLLATEPGLAAAVRRSMAALQAMADGLAGNGPGADVEYAAELIATQDVMGRLAAALEVGNGTNG